MSLLFAQPQQLYLEILADDLERAWQESQQLKNSATTWRAYLNRLLLDSFFAYLREDHCLSVKVVHQKKLLSIWTLLDGTLLSIQEQKLILLPTETIDDDEVTIPQEWVDIPSWVADYYVIAEVNPDEQWIRIKGYTTHAQIKKLGSFDAMTREYSLTQNQLIEDINVLWLSQEFCPTEVTSTPINLITDLNPTHAENLIQRLSNPEVISPRLEVPFYFWSALLENEEYLTKIAQPRQGHKAVENPVTKLTNWLENIFDNVWQTPADLNLAYAITRTFTANSLNRSKLIGIDNKQVILLVEVSQEKNDNLGVKIGLYPEANSRYLPPNIQLSLFSKEGQVLKFIKARHQDNYIAINKFEAPKNFEFKIEIKLNLAIKIENFMV